MSSDATRAMIWTTLVLTVSGCGSRPVDGGSTSGIPCGQSFQVGSLFSGCLATMDGLQIKFFPLAAGHKAARIAVYLHGDGAAEWKGNGAFQTIVPWAQQRDILVIAPLAPVNASPGVPAYGVAGDPETLIVGRAIQDFIQAYETSSDNLLFWSASGGSWFLTYSFLPKMGGQLQGAFAMSCGASEAYSPFNWDVAAASPRDKFHLFLNYGSHDFLVPGEEKSFTHYSDLGFSMERTVYDGANHCMHPVSEPTIAFWEKYL